MRQSFSSAVCEVVLDKSARGMFAGTGRSQVLITDEQLLWPVSKPYFF